MEARVRIYKYGHSDNWVCRIKWNEAQIPWSVWDEYTSTQFRTKEACITNVVAFCTRNNLEWNGENEEGKQW